MTDRLAEAARALLDAYFPNGCMNAEAHTLREALAAFDAQKEMPKADDWCQQHTIAARKILHYLGFACGDSLEPGCDRRSDRIAQMLAVMFPLDRLGELEEKERALEWLLALSRKSYGVDINRMSSVCSLRSRDIEDVVTTIGSGHTPLDAVLDAMKREVKP